MMVCEVSSLESEKVGIELTGGWKAKEEKENRAQVLYETLEGKVSG